jgi:predicted enzyme related to lactoylglutathione lyase
LLYIGVVNVDGAVSQATSLGASVVVPAMDIPGTGRFAVVRDPVGAAFALFTPAPTSPNVEETDPALGEFSWHELVTTDWEKSWAFYSAMFGWMKKDSMDMGPMGTYQMFGRDRFTYGGMYNKPKENPAPPHWLSYIMVKSVDAVIAKITYMGGKVLVGPMNVPGGDRVVMCMDPQGAAFALHSKGQAVVAVPRPATTTSAKPSAKPTPKASAKPKTKAKTKSKSKVSAAAKAKARPKVKTVEGCVAPLYPLSCRSRTDKGRSGFSCFATTPELASRRSCLDASAIRGNAANRDAVLARRAFCPQPDPIVPHREQFRFDRKRDAAEVLTAG